MPPHQRVAAVREMHERSTLPVQPEPMEPLPNQPARVNVTQWALPGLGIMSGVLGGLQQRVRPECSAPTGTDDVFLTFNGSVVTRRGEQVVVRHSDAFVAIRGAKGFSVARPTSVRFIGLRLPLRVLSPLVPDLDHCDVRVLPGGTGALHLLRRYVGLIAQEDALTTSELQQAAVAHIYDLAAVTLGTTDDRAELARQRGVRTARLETIKADIIAHLHDGNLAIAAIADRHGVTLRYLQKLFEDAGTSASEFTLGQRLEKAYRLLTNPLHSLRAISSIAYDVGFNDLSYFNRAFRRRFGSTPSDVRHGR
jgi:AraC-like DNA-binding protein